MMNYWRDWRFILTHATLKHYVTCPAFKKHGVNNMIYEDTYLKYSSSLEFREFFQNSFNGLLKNLTSSDASSVSKLNKYFHLRLLIDTQRSQYLR